MVYTMGQSNDGEKKMSDGLSLLAVFAHPDDESFGTGGVLARYAAEGVETSLVCATRGEAGEVADPSLIQGKSLSRVREAELRCACQILGIRNLRFLDYVDGQLARVDSHEAVGKLVRIIREMRPQVMLTFGPDGIYGHPDHIAVSSWATAAFASAADPSRYPEHLAEGLMPHAVSKLCYTVLSRSRVALIEQEFGPLETELNGKKRNLFGWDDDLVTCMDVSAYLETKMRAIQCHRTQIPPQSRFANPSSEMRWWMGTECFVLAESRLGKSSEKGADLFTGLR